MEEKTSEIVFLLDRTGSMMRIRDDAIGGFNSFLADQKKVPGAARLTLVQFDSQGPHEVVHDRIDLQGVPDLTEDTYRPRSGTPLYDALAWTIDHIGGQLEAAEEDRPDTVIFAILTDGEENASVEYTKDACFKRVKDQQEKYSWKFIYLGANQDAMKEAGNLGIKFDKDAQNVVGFGASAEGTQRAYRSIGQSTTHYRTGK